MGRRKKQQPLIQPKTPLESLIVLLIALPWCLWGIIKEYPIQSILVIGAIGALIVHIINKNKRQRIAAFKAFYNRETRLRFLNNDGYIDTELTNKILAAQQNGTTVAVGGKSDNLRETLFKNLTIAYDALQHSKNHTWGSLDAWGFTCSEDRALTAQNGIDALRTPLGLNFWGDGQGSYSFYLFPDTVLAFFEGPAATVFLAAFDPEAIVVFCEDAKVTREVVVNEKSQENIRYYDKFCPAPDAVLLDSHWKVTNKDGSRSFKGGLLPENNPLIFDLLYQQVFIEMGDYKVMTAFSNNKAAKAFEEKYDLYKWEPIHTRLGYSDGNIEDDEMVDSPVAKEKPSTKEKTEDIDDTFVRTNASISDVPVSNDLEATPRKESVSSTPPAVIEMAGPTVESNTPIEMPGPAAELTAEPEANDSGDGEVEAIRVRNREMAKNAVDVLNKTYPEKYDFKTYQVRKPRDGWNLQDAGVYTYVNDSEGNQYTIEFDLLTDLNVHKSGVRFSIWGKTKELVAQRYKVTVSKGKMVVNGEGYSVMIKREYETMSEADMSAAFTKDCMTLMKLVAYDDPK